MSDALNMKPYKTLGIASQTEVRINKSRFIGRAFPVTSEEEAKRILAELKKTHYDASHNCYAYIMRNGAARYSDDGEPGGTAGMPIMDVLASRGLNDALCVVTRYFGGILLGAGGLVRAYSRSAADAIAAAKEMLITPGTLMNLDIGYERYGALEAYIRETAVSVNTEFLDRIYIRATVLREKTKTFIDEITERSDGRVVLRITGEEYVKVPLQ